jgi:hypothetical protein
MTTEEGLIMGLLILVSYLMGIFFGYVYGKKHYEEERRK